MGRSGKGLITFLGLNTKTRPKKYKKTRFSIRNVSKKDPSDILREFEKNLIKVMRRIGPNMILLTVTFT